MQAIGGLLTLVFFIAICVAIVGAIMARTKGEGRGGFWKKAVGVAGASFVGLIVVAAVMGGEEASSPSVASAKPALESASAQPAPVEDAPAAENDLSLTLPSDEVQFIQAVLDAQAAYASAPNELKKTAVRVKRDRQLRVASPKGVVKDWYGQISEIGTTGDGNAHVTIKLPDHAIYMKTWNNEISDIGNETLIAFDSKLYSALSEMTEGQWVLFSGQLQKEASMTEAGGIREPEFIVDFSTIKSAFVDANGEPFAMIDDLN